MTGIYCSLFLHSRFKPYRYGRNYKSLYHSLKSLSHLCFPLWAVTDLDVEYSWRSTHHCHALVLSFSPNIGLCLSFSSISGPNTITRHQQGDLLDSKHTDLGFQIDWCSSEWIIAASWGQLFTASRLFLVQPRGRSRFGINVRYTDTAPWWSRQPADYLGFSYALPSQWQLLRLQYIIYTLPYDSCWIRWFRWGLESWLVGWLNRRPYAPNVLSCVCTECALGHCDLTTLHSWR